MQIHSRGKITSCCLCLFYPVLTPLQWSLRILCCMFSSKCVWYISILLQQAWHHIMCCSAIDGCQSIFWSGCIHTLTHPFTVCGPCREWTSFLPAVNILYLQQKPHPHPCRLFALCIYFRISLGFSHLGDVYILNFKFWWLQEKVVPVYSPGSTACPSLAVSAQRLAVLIAKWLLFSSAHWGGWAGSDWGSELTGVS